MIQSWVRHQPAAKRSASSPAFTVAFEQLRQRRANHAPIRSAVGSWSSTATGVVAPSSPTSARSATP